MRTLSPRLDLVPRPENEVEEVLLEVQRVELGERLHDGAVLGAGAVHRRREGADGALGRRRRDLAPGLADAAEARGDAAAEHPTVGARRHLRGVVRF